MSLILEEEELKDFGDLIFFLKNVWHEYDNRLVSQHMEFLLQPKTCVLNKECTKGWTKVKVSVSGFILSCLILRVDFLDWNLDFPFVSGSQERKVVFHT